MSNYILSEDFQRLLDIYIQAKDREKTYNQEEGEKIKVHQVSGKLAFFYEKIRNTVDYKEEHLLRKNAIERILKRRIITEKSEIDVAKYLVYELIRARYLPDKEIPEVRIKEVSVIIEKYAYILNNLPDHKSSLKGANSNQSVFDWIIGVASCEIEECLVLHHKELAIVEFAMSVLVDRIQIESGVSVTEQERRELIYVALLKGLIKSDLAYVRYRILLAKRPNWLNMSQEDLLNVTDNMHTVITDVESVVSHYYVDFFTRAVKKYLAYFAILQEVLINNTSDSLRDICKHSYKIEDAIRDACIRTYRDAKTKLNRAAVRSVLYIFLTKMVIALIIELPFDKYIVKDVNYVVLMINILFPVFLMALVVFSIRIPGTNNTNLIIQGVQDMIYNRPVVAVTTIKRPIGHGSFFMSVFKLLYLVVFIASFSAVIWFLKFIGFNFVSIGLFIFFLCVVSYFGIRISKNARSLVVVQRKEGVMSFIMDLFTTPIIQVGYWMSVKLANINIITFVFDFIIEAPFKIFVDIFEQWIYYVKEEKEKIE